MKASELKKHLSSKIFNEYFKFGFVRNPWNWQVSLYIFMLKNKSHHQHHLLKKIKSFDEYIDWRVNYELRLQKDFFFDKKGKCIVDYIGKFEDIGPDFKMVCEEIGVEEDLPHLNKSRDSHKFLKYYSDKSLEMICEAFQEDIAAFNYIKPTFR